MLLPVRGDRNRRRTKKTTTEARIMRKNALILTALTVTSVAIVADAAPKTAASKSRSPVVAKAEQQTASAPQAVTAPKVSVVDDDLDDPTDPVDPVDPVDPNTDPDPDTDNPDNPVDPEPTGDESGGNNFGTITSDQKTTRVQSFRNNGGTAVLNEVVLRDSGAAELDLKQNYAVRNTAIGRNGSLVGNSLVMDGAQVDGTATIHQTVKGQNWIIGRGHSFTANRAVLGGQIAEITIRQAVDMRTVRTGNGGSTVVNQFVMAKP